MNTLTFVSCYMNRKDIYPYCLSFVFSLYIQNISLIQCLLTLLQSERERERVRVSGEGFIKRSVITSREACPNRC